jgi:hypothetical protein
MSDRYDGGQRFQSLSFGWPVGDWCLLLAYSRFSNAVANVQSQRIILWWQCLRLSVKLITATAGWRIESSAVSKQKIWKDIKKLPVTASCVLTFPSLLIS